MEMITDDPSSTDGTEKSQNDDAMNGLEGQKVVDVPLHPSNMAGYEFRPEATFGLKLVDINKMHLGDSVYSRVHYVRNLPWRIVVTPRMTLTLAHEIRRTLGFYLMCNEQSKSTSWWCHAVIQFRLLTHRPDKKIFCRILQHKYSFAESDWGMSDFINWDDMLAPENGYVKNNSVTVEVHLTADAPHGVGWNSKGLTGHVGLQNRGAQCYMNSLLQTLFFTNQLRRAIYNIPVEWEGSGKSVVAAMQHVFLGLQFSDISVDTKRLTASLGWTALDSFAQQDVQEFLRTLLDKLETEMKATSTEGSVRELLEGTMLTTIRCKNVDYTSTRRETFQDIQLSVAGKKNIYESFQEYVDWESLAGSNRYAAGEHGLQEAEKSVAFVSLPPVLYLHLKRFLYDSATDSSVKLNDRFEFYEHISLGEYLQEEEVADYTLQAVLVHSGWEQGGHYVAFIDPRLDGDWCKFDDEVVSSSTKTAAIECNYGGPELEQCGRYGDTTNAYMLVYIRDTDIPSVLQDVPEKEIPQPLLDRLAEQRKAEMYMMVNVVVEDVFNGHQGFDLYDPEYASPQVIHVLKRATIVDLMKILEDVYGCSVERMRIWRYIERSNRTYRPALLDLEFQRNDYVEEVAFRQNPWNIFLELLPPHSGLAALPLFDSNEHVLLFLKLYDPVLKRIHYSGHAYLPLSRNLRDFIPTLNERAGFPPDTELVLYEEIRPNLIEKIKSLDDLPDTVMSELMDGDIIVFQKAETTEESDLPTCVDYFRDLFYRVQVRFVNYIEQKDSGFTMELSLHMTCEAMKHKVAECAGIEPQQLLLFRCQRNNTLGRPLRYQPKDLLQKFLSDLKPKKLFYLQKGTRSNELEHLQEFRCLWLSPDLKEETELILYPNQWDNIENLLDEALSHVELSPEEGSGRLRIVRVADSKLKPGPKPNELLMMLTTTNDIAYRIEEIPHDQLHLRDDEMLVPCAHFNKKVYFTFGVPFYIRTKQDEPFHFLKDRIQETLDVPDEEWDTYKFAVVVAGKPSYISADTYVVNLQDFRPQIGFQSPWLGLDHEDLDLEMQLMDVQAAEETKTEAKVSTSEDEMVFEAQNPFAEEKENYDLDVDINELIEEISDNFTKQNDIEPN